MTKPKTAKTCEKTENTREEERELASEANEHALDRELGEA